VDCVNGEVESRWRAVSSASRNVLRTRVDDIYPSTNIHSNVLHLMTNRARFSLAAMEHAAWAVAAMYVHQSGWIRDESIVDHSNSGRLNMSGTKKVALEPLFPSRTYVFETCSNVFCTAIVPWSLARPCCTVLSDVAAEPFMSAIVFKLG
jgi:hypothetical protein